MNTLCVSFRKLNGELRVSLGEETPSPSRNHLLIKESPETKSGTHEFTCIPRSRVLKIICVSAEILGNRKKLLALIQSFKR